MNKVQKLKHDISSAVLFYHAQKLEMRVSDYLKIYNSEKHQELLEEISKLVKAADTITPTNTARKVTMQIKRTGMSGQSNVNYGTPMNNLDWDETEEDNE